MMRKVGFGLDIIDEMILNNDIAQQAVAVARAEGVAQGKLESLRTQWLKKFGPLTSDVETALDQATVELLDQVIDQMVDPAYTLIEARAQLGL